MADDFDPDSIEVLEDETDGDYRRIRKDLLDNLRKAAKTPRALREENAALKREKLVRTAKLDNLSELQVSVLASQAGDDATPEALRTLAKDLGWEVPEPEQTDEQREQQQIDAEAQAHGDIAAASVGGGATATRQPTGADYAQWPIDKRMRFQNEHPQLAEAMMRDPSQPIQLPAGFV